MDINFSQKRFKRIKHNSYYLGLLQNLYAGSEGEVCCFLQYIYQCNILKPFNENLAQEYYELAMEELSHQNLLAEAIVMFSGDPMYINAQSRWLGGRNIDYIKNINQMIEMNLETKNKVIIDYKIAIEKIDDIEIKNVLTEIVNEEKLQKEKLIKIKLKYCN